jgi:hypothetical protein
MSRAKVTIAIALLSAAFLATPSAARAEEEEPAENAEETEGEDPVLVNAFAFGPAYSFHFLNHRDDAETGEPLGTREHLGGFFISYSRHLIPEHLALTISKPFLFNKERFDTPFDFLLRGLFRKGSWEGFIGLLLTWNIRVFEREREAKEGEKNVLSFGIGGVVGGAYFFNPRWSLDAEVSYAYVPTEDIVEHELSAALSGVYHF